MQEIPDWIIKVIEMENLTCRNCKDRFEVKNLMSIGIQESSAPPHKDVLCIGMFCAKCKELIIFELQNMTLVEFGFEILDQETSNKIKKKETKEKPAIMQGAKKSGSIGRSRKRSKITAKEVEEAKKFLKPKDLKHEEFLIALGMLPEEIEKYNKKEK